MAAGTALFGADPRRLCGALLGVALLAGCRAYNRDDYLRALDGGAPPDALADVGVDAGMDTALDGPPGVDVAPDTLTPGDVPRADAAESGTDVVESGTDAASDAALDGVGLDPTSCDDVNGSALFCDGFEDTALLAWGGPDTTSGTLGRTTATAYRGAGALRAQSSALGGHAFISAGLTPARTSGELFLRGYFQFPSGYAIDDIAFLSAMEGNPPYGNIAFQVVNGGQPSVYATPGMRFITGVTSSIVPRDRWVCLEMHVTVSPSAGAVEMFLDGALVGRASGFSTLPTGGIDTLAVGINFASAVQDPAVVFVDEVVVATTRVGCD